MLSGFSYQKAQHMRIMLTRILVSVVLVSFHFEETRLVIVADIVVITVTFLNYFCRSLS